MVKFSRRFYTFRSCPFRYVFFIIQSYMDSFITFVLRSCYVNSKAKYILDFNKIHRRVVLTELVSDMYRINGYHPLIFRLERTTENSLHKYKTMRKYMEKKKPFFNGSIFTVFIQTSLMSSFVDKRASDTVFMFHPNIDYLWQMWFTLRKQM